jgi:tRNA-Thr(GGU) m(6)t(6)A37 methyltransferase TsaA
MGSPKLLQQWSVAIMEIVQIGTVHSPYTEIGQIPRCAVDRLEEVAVVEVFHEFSDGLQDLDGFSHVMLIVHMHKAEEVKLRVLPPIDDQIRGVFATRSPMRPNHLGVSVVELLKVEGRNLRVKGIDLLDGTPLVDIKPFTNYDIQNPIRIGWLEGKTRQGKGPL